MKKPWIICALMGWGMFALAMSTPQQAPAQQGKDSGGGGDEGGVAAASPCVGDVNNNGVVNIDDLVLLITNWGACPGCQTASQCNDNNLCTTDTCQFGVCVHTPIPNCVTCTNNAQCAILYPNAQGICQAGLCVMGPCSMGYANCNMSTADGCEVFVQGDPQNCGTCNAPCILPNAQAMCVNGQCMIGSCNLGFQNCNGLTADGCETNITNNVLNCGTCNSVCILPNAVSLCVNGQCMIGSCNMGYANCNNLVADGCEIHLLSNIQNCGLCGLPCSGTQTCVNGICQ